MFQLLSTTKRILNPCIWTKESSEPMAELDTFWNQSIYETVSTVWNKVSFKKTVSWEDTQLVPCVGKHVTGAKRGKTCNQPQARESM